MDNGHPVGRERELGLVTELLAGEPPLRPVLLSGAAGIGKTTLWEAALVRARVQGLRVLASRASGAEAQLSFAGLIDLLDGIDLATLDGVPAPQRGALDVALLRAEPWSDPPEPQAIALGLLNVLRALSAEKLVLLAIDDVQWLDTPSCDALAFAVRRLRNERVAILLARRSGTAGVVEQALDPRRVEQIDVGPLSLGALRRMLSDRLGLTLPRLLLRRIADTTLGNPLFALELGRLIAGRGLPGIADELPVPDAVDDLLDARVGDLSAPVQRLLLALSLSAELRVSQLEQVADADALDEAVASGFVVVERDRARPYHPLLGALVKRRARGVERRKLHLELADIVADEQLRARHLALGTAAPDEEIGATVADAAAAASARGTRREAVELGEHALRLTPRGSAARSETVLSLAAYLETAGELQRMTDLLTSELDSIPPGPLRARTWLLLSEGMHVRNVDDYKQHLERALAEAHDDPALRARVAAMISSAVIGVEQIHDAERRLLDVLPDARRAGPDVERAVLYALAWARGLAGRPLDEVCERFAAAAASPGFLAHSPERVAAQRHVWRGEIEQARAAIERLFVLADERGEAVAVAWARIHLCELALRVGNWATSERLLAEWAETSDGELFVTPAYQRCRGLLAAGRGLPEEAERWAREAIAGASTVGTQWDWLEGLRTLGMAASLRHEPAAALESLRTAWAHLTEEGVDEPGVFPVAPDLVEALVEAGELDEAREVTERLRLLSEQQEHPWGLVTARRCDALIRLASDAYDEEAAKALEQVADEYGALALPFDRARTLLALGRVQRRRRKWAAARLSLEQALLGFEELDAPGWAEEARADLARVGARRPTAPGALTPAEQRVAELAAAGHTNKEIARTLFVAPKTVEIHLSHVYAKLGVRSRTQLARIVQS